MRLPRPSFLPIFFTCLVIAFSIAVTLRIRSYSKRALAPSAVEATSSTSSTSPDRDRNSQGTVVAVTEGEATSTAEGMSQARASARALREQRYEQLLASPPPGATAGRPVNPASPAGAPVPVQAPPKPAPKPSILPRTVNAVSGGPTPAPAPARSTDRRADDKDPNSDTTPPQLMGIEFAPPAVHDGETIALTVYAQDDASGIKSVVGNVVGPSAAILGFALSREADTLRYSGKIPIPKNAADGNWHVNYLSLTDNAGNSKALLWAQGALPETAVFRVNSSAPDNTPPTLKRVWLERPSMKVGEKNTMYVQADDDKSGVSLVTGVFVSPQKFARFGFGCRQNAAVWECELVPPAAAECGDWPLEQVSLQDGAGNPVTLRSDNPIVSALRLNILTDQCDARPPAIQSIRVDPVRLGRPSTLTVTVLASDDLSGVASISGYFAYAGAVQPGARPPQLPFFCRPAGDGQSWTGTIAITGQTPRGIWRLSSIQALDKANNLKVYSMADPVVSSVALRIE